MVLCLGTSLQVEAEGRDRRDLNLPGAQQPLLEAVFAANPRVGSCSSTPAPSRSRGRTIGCRRSWPPGIPGEAGGIAIARALFGVDNPGGKLPYTVYANLDGVPPQNEYDVSKGYTYQYLKGVPLYPFGHGLSYTRFRFSNLTLSASSIARHRPGPGRLRHHQRRRPRRRRSGAALHAPGASRSYQPMRTLRAFRRVTLEPNQTTRVTFTLPASQLAWYQVERSRRSRRSWRPRSRRLQDDLRLLVRDF